jgi:uncharacterized protein YjlB
MTTVSGTFTGLEASDILKLDRLNKHIDINISGTYNMVIVLERASSNTDSWEEVARYDVANATVADIYHTTKKREWLRLKVKEDTSGTATYSFNDNPIDTVIVRDEEQEIVARFHEDGVHFPGTVTADGGLGGSGLDNVVEDLTPQLGGDLDVNGQSIVSAAGGDIAITPDTTGDVILDGVKWPQADGAADEVLKTDGAGQSSWVAQSGGDVVDDLTPQLGGDLDVNGQSIVSAAAGDIAITPDTTGDIILDGVKWPQADGTANYVLQTDGAGQASWVEQTGGSSVNVGLPFSGAMVNLTADETISNDTNTQIPWDAAVYDEGGWWSAASPTRFTVPSGVTKIRLAANVVWTTVFASSTAFRLLYQFKKNGSTFEGDASNRRMQFEVGDGGLVSAVVEVSAGDYFELDINQNRGSSADIDAQNLTWFAVEAVETTAASATPRGALVGLSANLTSQNLTSITAIPFDVEVYDTDLIHDNVTNNERLTVPAGVTHVRLHGQIGLSAITTSQFVQLQVYKNGADTDPITISKNEISGTSVYTQVSTAVIEVVEGDYFELMVRVESDTSVSVLDLGSLFSMEIVGPAVVSGIVPAATGMPWKGASVSLTANESIANATVIKVPFDQADIDIGGWWDSAAPTRLTVPAGITKVRLHAGFIWDAVTGDRCFLRIIMNGATVSGGGGSDLDQQYSQLSQSHATPTIVVSEGDYFEVQAYQNSGIAANILTNDNTYFSIEAVESIAPSVTPRGSLVTLAADDTTKSANQSIANSTSTAITWDQETYDSDNLHDNATNNSRMTVPAGVTHVRLDASITFAVHGTGYRTVYFYKNGTTIVSRIQIDPSATADTMMSLSSQVLEVVEGDYFEVWVKHTRGAALNVNTGVASWFNMEIVGPTVVTTTETSAGQPFKGALVSKAADETAANYTAGVAVPWTSEIYDVGGWHSNATNNERLTVPAGVTKVRLAASLYIQAMSAGQSMAMSIKKNGSADVEGLGEHIGDSNGSSGSKSISSCVVEVVEGDYFELHYTHETDTSITVFATRSFFSIEAVESIAPATTPRGAMVHLAADETAANYTVATAIPFDSEVYDTDDIHDNSTNNTRLTVPAGVTHVRLTGSVLLTSLTAEDTVTLAIYKGGTVDWIGSPHQYSDTGSSSIGVNISTAVIEVVEGDYFELSGLRSGG